MGKTKRNKGLEWCPEADLNHRHADFQAGVNRSSSSTYDENAVKPDISNQLLSDDLSTENAAIKDAARWLVTHRSECVGPLIPILKNKFGLRNIEAIAVTKIAHALRYGGAR